MLQHLACIMDGNRRWAQNREWLPWYGHKEGIESIHRVIDFCLEKNIPLLSLFAFAIQNFKRPKTEIDFLFSMMRTHADQVMEILVQKKVKIVFVGDRTLFPDSLQEVCLQLEKKTASYKSLQVNILFCYGGQEEIVAGVRAIVADVAQGIIALDDISPTLLNAYLWTGNIPGPELIIRTGGQQRLSNFFLFQAAYSEFYFLDCLWPDITADHLMRALTYYNDCKRNFGI